LKLRRIFAPALPAPAGAPSTDDAALGRQLIGPRRAGLALIGVFVLGFGGWAATAPLAGGAVAQGVISPEGSRKTIQHLEGGIVAALHVRDGDKVRRGQPLITLDSVQARAVYEAALDKYLTLAAARDRLEAEQAGTPEIAFSQELLSHDQKQVAGVLESQRRLFATRLAMRAAEADVLRQRMGQLHEQVEGWRAQMASAARQGDYIHEELAGKEALLAKGLTTKPEVLRLRRAGAEIGGSAGQYRAQMASAEQQIGETRLQLLALDAQNAEKIADELDQVRAQLDTARQQLAASKDVLGRTVVTAPVSGTVVGLQVKTEGGVVRPGERLMDVVPDHDALIIEARVSPKDVDVVHPGLAAQIHLSAFSSREQPRIDGVVKTISADRLTDAQTGVPYYLARVEVDPKTLRRFSPHARLVPGMPADVLIVTGERTLLDYLTEPFLNVLRRSFREV
jgi:HlyD family secretion protein/epimerase transport system membrane fusion protein